MLDDSLRLSLKFFRIVSNIFHLTTTATTIAMNDSNVYIVVCAININIDATTAWWEIAPWDWNDNFLLQLDVIPILKYMLWNTPC